MGDNQTHSSFPAAVTGEGKGTYSEMILPPSPWGIEQGRTVMVHQAWQVWVQTRWGVLAAGMLCRSTCSYPNPKKEG